MSRTAIITGDIVSSRGIDKTTRENLYTAIDEFARSLRRKWIDKYERFRGDSIQCSVHSLSQALHTALLIRCFVMSYTSLKKKKQTAKGYLTTQFDIRLSIGIGTVDFLNEKKLSSSDGEAFVLSGHSLDNLKKSSERMVLKTTDEAANKEWEIILSLLDAIMQKWTQNGAELALQKLLGKRDDEVAQQLNISLSAITQRKKNAQWSAVNKAIEYFEVKFSA